MEQARRLVPPDILHTIIMLYTVDSYVGANIEEVDFNHKLR